MTEKRQSIHGQWSSRLMFILAATGSAVGLGNIWKFPYITGEYGGGAFVLVYLVCIAVVGVPIMMAEILLGRRGRRSPINTMRLLAEEARVSKAWAMLGWVGVLAGFLIMSYYSVIAGWALAYVRDAITGTFAGFDGEQASAHFGQLVGNPWELAFWHSIFTLLTILVLARGVRSGLEQAVRVLMPMLFVLLIIMLGYAMNTGQFAEGMKFLFTPDFSKLTGDAVLTALGHAFFTLSLGMGAIMIYGSYMPHKASIATTSMAVAFMDTLVALAAGMAIFPIVFANGLEPGAGPGLVFVSLPIAFGQMPGGIFFGTLFFVLLVFAAWTSAISLIEPATAWLVENRGMQRAPAAVSVGFLVWLGGLVTVMSFNDWAFSFNFGGIEKTDGMFDVLDILTSVFMLPLGGLAIAWFTGWIMKRAHTAEELNLKPFSYKVWYVLIRYVSPIAVIVLFLHSLGAI